MKQEILQLMYKTGAFEPLRLANRRKALILHYHRFSVAPRVNATPAGVFEQQLAYLCRRYEIIPLSVIVNCLATGTSLPSRTAAITVDDGYRDFYEVALPILRRFGAPATVFVVADYLDGKRWIWTDRVRYILRRAFRSEMAEELISEFKTEQPVGRRCEAGISNGLTTTRTCEAAVEVQQPFRDDKASASAADSINSALKSLPENRREVVIADIALRLGVDLPESPPDDYRALSWAEVRELAASGIEVGSHSMTHPILTLESDERARYELRESKSKIERLTGGPVAVFCYPNGDYDRRTIMEARRSGYIGAVTCHSGLNTAAQSPFELKRVHTVDDFAHFLQGTSGLEQIKLAISPRPFPQGMVQRYRTAE